MIRTSRTRAARGAAAVEMALSMLVIIPVFMYALFLDDLLRYSLDVQEAALSTAWDFTVQDYNKPLKKAGTTAMGPKGGDTVVQKQARLMFCDHESGKDRYTEMRTVTNPDGTSGQNFADCVEENHHEGTALVGHVCWLNEDFNKAKQVTCEDAERGVGSLGDSYHGAYMDEFTNGGLIRCSAKAVVENYLLPEGFLNDSFSKVELSKENWKHSGSGSYHNDAKAGTDETAYFLAEQRLAILTDTWALTDDVTTLPGDKSGEMYRRVETVYQHQDTMGGYLQLQESVASFFQEAVSSQLLSPAPFALMALSAEDEGGADNPKSPNVAMVPQPTGDGTSPENSVTQGGSSSNYFNTEWQDWDEDNNKKTYQERGVWYMGCKNPGTC